MTARLSAILGVALCCEACKKPAEQAGPANQTEVRSHERAAGEKSRKPSASIEAIARSPDDEGLALRVSKLGTGELIQLAKLAEADRYSPAKSYLFAMAIAELSKRDADAALSFFPPDSLKLSEPGLAGVFSELAKSNPEALKKWLKNELTSVSSTEIQTRTLATALAFMSKVDAKSALEFYTANTWKGVPENAVINQIFFEYAIQSPDEAMAAVSKFHLNSQDVESVMLQISYGASKEDPAKGLEAAKKIATGTRRGAALTQALSSWLGRDPAGAIEKLKSLGPQDTQLLLQCDARMNGRFMQAVGKADAAAMFTLLSQVTPSSANEGIFLAAVSNSTPETRQQLSAFLSSFPEGPLKENLIQRQYSSLAGEDLAAAVESAQSLNDNSRILAYKAIGATADLENLFAISGKLTGKSQEAIWGTALPKLARSEPAQASQLLNDPRVVIPASERGSIVESIGYGFNDADPAKSDVWYASLSAADQIAAMTGIARNLARKDMIRLSEKLGSMPQDKAWAAGVGVLIESIKDADPEVAGEWRQTLKSAGFK